MKTTNFAKYLSEFLTVYMVNERGFSHNTIKSYRDTFVQFISYISEHKLLCLQLERRHLEKRGGKM